MDIPHRKFKTPRLIDQRVQIKEYQGTLRQLLVADLDHEEPTVLLTNDFSSSPKAIITRYAQRMLIENGLSDSIEFFHLDSLSSAVALNVDLDVLLTVIASGIYRLFAKSLRGYERAQARQVFRRFLDTSASVSVSRALKGSAVLGRPILRHVRSWPSSTCCTAGSSQTRWTVLSETAAIRAASS